MERNRAPGLRKGFGEAGQADEAGSCGDIAAWPLSAVKGGGRRLDHSGVRVTRGWSDGTRLGDAVSASHCG